MLRLAKVLPICTSAAVMAVAWLTPTAAADLPVIQSDQDGVFFSIGEEDGYRYPYRRNGWTAIDEHTCVVGVDCDTRLFPSHLRTISGKSDWADTAVEKLIITFRLDRTYDNVFLRLVRSGAETVVVRLNEGDAKLVTKSMMEPPTYEHSDFGAFDLPFGQLSEGEHLLQLSVAEDGEGNGRFGWDAIKLQVGSE